MKKNIFILLLSALLTNPLYSVTNYEDSDDFEYVPKETLIKFQHLQNENEELKAEIERLKKLHLEGIKIEEKEEKGKEPEDDTPTSPSSDLLVEEKLGQNGFNLKLIELYSRYSPTFAKHAGAGNCEELINSKTRISRELFLAALRNSGSKEESFLIEESAHLGTVDTYKYSCPYSIYIAGAWAGRYGFKQDIKRAMELIDHYAKNGNEIVRRIHLEYLRNEAQSKHKDSKEANNFRMKVFEYIEAGSHVALEFYLPHLSWGGFGFEKLDKEDHINKLHYFLFEKKYENRQTFHLYLLLKSEVLEPVCRNGPIQPNSAKSQENYKKLAAEYARVYKREDARGCHILPFRIINPHDSEREERDNAIQEYLEEDSEIARDVYFRLIAYGGGSIFADRDYVSEVEKFANQGSKVAQRLHIESLDRGLNGFKQDPQEADRLRVEYGIF